MDPVTTDAAHGDSHLGQCAQDGASRSESRRYQRSGAIGHRSPRPRAACRPRATGHALGGSVHRYYDPLTGQFLSVDPLVDVTGMPYSFAAGDPVNGSDPSGLACNGPCSTPWGTAVNFKTPTVTYYLGPQDEFSVSVSGLVTVAGGSSSRSRVAIDSFGDFGLSSGGVSFSKCQTTNHTIGRTHVSTTITATVSYRPSRTIPTAAAEAAAGIAAAGASIYGFLQWLSNGLGDFAGA
jgi:RHS repeat-associated protein